MLHEILQLHYAKQLPTLVAGIFRSRKPLLIIFLVFTLVNSVHVHDIAVQDLTVTIMSELLEREVELEDDHRQPSTINVESFVDEQEWRLYQEVETFQSVVNKFYEGDSEMCAHPSFSCRTHASRRPGFYITNFFVVMVTVSLPYIDSLMRLLQQNEK